MRAVVPSFLENPPIPPNRAFYGMSVALPVETIFAVETFVVDAAEAAGTGSSWNKLENIQKASAQCGENSMPYYDARASHLADLTMAKMATTSGLNLAALAVAPETFGLGTLGLWALTYGIDKALDYRLDKSLSDLEEEMALDPDCRPPDDGDGDGDGEGPGAGSGAGPGGGKPHWLRDPSGIVYEVTMDDAIQGVTATALYEIGYNPDAQVARQDMFLMLYNAMTKLGLIEPVSASDELKWLEGFADNRSGSDYARIGMSTFIKEGVVGGKGDGILDPTGTATRAEAAQTIYNMLLRDAQS